MSLQVGVDERDGCLRVIAEGTWSLRDVQEVVDLVGAESRKRGLTRVVLDMREVGGDPLDMDRLRVGEHAAAVLGSRIRMAVICREEMINWFAEGVAVQSGADVKVFSIEGEAVEWVGVGEG